MLKFPNIDPILFTIGPFEIRWYGLAYIAGIVLGYYLLKFLDNKNDKAITKQAFDNIITYAVLGIIIGGRLGYVLFYGFDHYLSSPLEIIKTWEGGMSFHGGFLGFTLAMWLFCKKYQISFLYLSDLVAVCAPIGIFFGRIANFINGELYGRVTESMFGMVFSMGGPEPRHPSQIYEALTEGMLSFIILLILILKTDISRKRGVLSGLFLLLYSLSRKIIENFREPDHHIGYILDKFTMGQILSLPMLIVGVVLIINSFKEEK